MTQSRREAKFELLDDCDAWTYYEPGKGPKRKRQPSLFYLLRWHIVLVLVVVALVWLVGIACGCTFCLLLR